MISTPFFAHNQSLSFSSVSGLFFQTSAGQPTFISLFPESCGVPDPTLKFLPVPVDIVASSSGLLCCQAKTGDRAYFICNPVTKQWKKLPKQSMEHGREPAVVLIFKPSLLNFVAEYKLVCAFPSLDFADATEFEIYSSKNESWNLSGEITYAAKKLISKSGVSVNDVVYWQTTSGSILSFDLTKDRSLVMEECFHGGGILGEINGKLCSASISGNLLMVNVISNIYFNTMEMDSNAQLWKNKINLPVTSAMRGGTPSYNPIHVLYAGSEMVVLLIGYKIYYYDLKTKEAKFVGESAQFNRKAIPYVNSLVAL